jgi:hypothetical protein
VNFAGLQITKQFYIGYAYDYSVTDLNNYNDGSHEIILRYQCYKNSNKINPKVFLKIKDMKSFIY